MSDNVRINQLAEAVMKGLTEYADLTTDDMKTRNFVVKEDKKYNECF